jgi:hypothetical protein
MDYRLPNVNIKHFTKTQAYDGDFSTLFVIFSKNILVKRPILLTKKHQFEMIEDIQEDIFLKNAIEAFFVNGGDRLYLLFIKIGQKRFNLDKFHNILVQECDGLNDIELISAINVFDEDLYLHSFSMKEILKIQATINNYCSVTHRISITDINKDFENHYLNSLGKSLLYYPWIINKKNKALPPSIYAAGLFSKMAKANKYFESIANKELLNTQDIELRLDENELELLRKNRINPVIFMPHRGVRFWGVKSFDENLDTINEVRVLKYIKRKLVKMSQVYLFEPNTIFLEAQVILMVKVFLSKLENIGAILAFDVERNDESLIKENEIIIDIAVALATPIEFINIRLNKIDKDSTLTIN